MEQSEEVKLHYLFYLLLEGTSSKKPSLLIPSVELTLSWSLGSTVLNISVIACIAHFTANFVFMATYIVVVPNSGFKLLTISILTYSATRSTNSGNLLEPSHSYLHTGLLHGFL